MAGLDKTGLAPVDAILALDKGSKARAAKIQEAKALEDAANRKMAVTTAEMAEQKRVKAHMESRAIAVAAASGGGVDDPTIVQLIGDLNAEGEYRVMSRLWVGQNEAKGLRFQANEARKEGEDALNQAYVSVAKTVMSFAGGGFGGGFGGAASIGPAANKVTASSKSAVQVQYGGLEIPGYGAGAQSA